MNVAIHTNITSGFRSTGIWLLDGYVTDYSDGDLAASLPTEQVALQPDNLNVFNQDGEIHTNSYAQHGGYVNTLMTT